MVSCAHMAECACRAFCDACKDESNLQRAFRPTFSPRDMSESMEVTKQLCAHYNAIWCSSVTKLCACSGLSRWRASDRQLWMPSNLCNGCQPAAKRGSPAWWRGAPTGVSAASAPGAFPSPFCTTLTQVQLSKPFISCPNTVTQCARRPSGWACTSSLLCKETARSAWQLLCAVKGVHRIQGNALEVQCDKEALSFMEQCDKKHLLSSQGRS